jgi:hypothetical protein
LSRMFTFCCTNWLDHLFKFIDFQGSHHAFPTFSQPCRSCDAGFDSQELKSRGGRGELNPPPGPALGHPWAP